MIVKINKIKSKISKILRAIIEKILSLEFYEDIVIAVLKFFIRRNPISPFYAFWRTLFVAKEWKSFRKYFAKFDKSFSSHHPFVSALGSFVFLFLIVGGVFFFAFNETKDAAAWWNDGWKYRKVLEIDHANVGEDLSAFPVLVSLTDTNLASSAQADGDDITFVSSSGVKFSHEIEEYNDTTGKLTAWVRIPLLSGSVDTKILMYYGNETVVSQQDAENVWDEKFTLVQHMDEDPSGTAPQMLDSTSNDCDGTNQDGTMTSDDQVAGKIGGALDFDGNGDAIVDEDGEDYLNGLTQTSLSMWVKAIDVGSDRGIIAGKDPDGTDTTFTFRYDAVGALSPTVNLIKFGFGGTSDGTTTTFESQSNLQSTDWQHITATWKQGEEPKFYFNGMPSAKSASPIENQPVSGATKFIIGKGSKNSTWYGQIDEVRISTDIRSAAWIKAEYDNQNDPTSFFSVGKEENSPGNAIGYWRFDKGFGDVAYDSSGQSHGTISGATWKTEEECISEHCLYFDGEDDYVEIDSENLAPDDELTLEAWVKTEDNTLEDQAILTKGEPTKIFRSVGVGSTTALQIGTGNDLTISGTRATFTSSLLDKIGVGDAIQYDADDGGVVDQIVFISERISSTEYEIKKADGTTPVVTTTADQNWSIFRAYTGLSLAESGTENTGIDAAVRAFESWSWGRDLITNNEQWNIACYADAPETDAFRFSGWKSGPATYLKVYTPYLTSEVGISQRHEGVWDTNKFHFLSDGTEFANIYFRELRYAKAEGLQLKTSGNGSALMTAVTEAGDAEFEFSYNILQGSGDSSSSIGINPDTSNGNFKIWNNIIYNFGKSSIGRGILIGRSRDVEIYNNVLWNISMAVYNASATGTVLAKNNVVFGNNDDFYDPAGTMTEEYNASDDGNGTDPIAVADWNTAFVDYANADFRPTKSSPLVDAGKDLSTDANLKFTDDLIGKARADSTEGTGSLWDVGALESTNNFTSKIRATGNGGDFELLSAWEAAINSDLTAATSKVFMASSVGTYSSATDDGQSVTFTGGGTGTLMHINADKTAYVTGISGTVTAGTVTITGGNTFVIAGTGAQVNWALAECYDDWSGGLEDAVAIGGWTTSLDHYIKIYTPQDQRHTGTAGTGFHIKSQGSYAFDVSMNNLNDGFVRIEGLEIEVYSPSAHDQRAIEINGGNDGTDQVIYINDNIIRGDADNTLYRQYGVDGDMSNGETGYIYNNIIYDFKRGYSDAITVTSYPVFYIQNNTIYNNADGVTIAGNNSVKYIENNISVGNARDFNGVIVTGSDYNISSDDTALGEHSSQNVALEDLSFVSTTSGAEDFRLNNNSVAIGEGSPTNPSFFTDDIRGSERVGVWDIGAVEYVEPKTIQGFSFGVDLTTDELTFSHDNSGTLYSFASDSVDLENEKWKHIAYRRDATDEYFFIDGVLQKQQTRTGGVAANNSKLYIGAKDAFGASTFKGFLDEVRVYSYARSDVQIQTDYNSGITVAPSAKGTGVSFGNKSKSWMTDGLVGHWKMDETSWDGTSGEVVDASGKGNNGTAQGGLITSSGKFGKGAALDGTDDYIDLGMVSDFRESSEMTVSIWYYPTADGEDYWMFTRGDSSTDTNLFLFWADDECMGGVQGVGNTNTFAFSVGDSSVWNNRVNGPNGIRTLNEWHHITGVMNGSYRALYHNGELVASHNSASTLDTGTTTTDISSLGRWEFGSRMSGGRMDEFRFYNRALSSNEIGELYEDAPSPVLHLKMDEKTGTMAYDTSGNELNGAFSNSPDWVRGKFGSALDFDGSTEKLVVEYDEQLDMSDNFSISGWIKPGDVAQQWQGFLVKGADGGEDTRNYGLYLNYDELYFSYKNVTYKAVKTSSANLLADRWYHVAYERTLTNDIFYLDGKKVYQANFTDSLVAGNENLFIGGQRVAESATEYFQGSLDDLRIYNYARTQKQVLEDMNMGGSANKTPVLHLTFDEGRGATAYDKSIYQNNGILTSGAGGTNTTVTAMWDKGGKIGGAMEFDGTDDYVEEDTQVIAEYPFTMSSWVKTTDTGSSEPSVIMRVLDKDVSGVAYGIHLSPTNYQAQMRARNTFVYETTGATSLNDGNWHHIAGVWASATDRRLYVDGIRDATNENNTSVTYSGAIDRWDVGRAGDSTPNSYFDGLIDEPKIYNYTLSESEIKQEYAAGGKAFQMGGVDSTANNNGTAVTGASAKYCVPGDTAQCDAPVLELALDEKTGTIAYDTSGNGNDGIFSSAPAWTRGRLGSALNFDGVDDYIAIDENSGDFDITSAITISAWIKLDVINDHHQRIFHKDAAYNFGVASVDSKLFFYNENGNTVYSNLNIISSLQWYHVVATKNSSGVKFYVNGVFMHEDTSGNATPDLPTNNYNVFIGIDEDGISYPFDGLMDDVRVYDYVRTPAQIAWDYNRGKPIAHWKFDEGVGTTVHDESGNGFDGTMNNMDADTDWVDGKNGGALDFDGGNDYVDLGEINQFAGGEISISHWFKADSADGMVLMKFDAVSGADFQSAWVTTGATPQIRSMIGASYRYAPYTLGNWVFTTTVYNGSSLKIYKNGVLVDSVARSGGISSNSEHWLLGVDADAAGNGDLGNYFDGIIDDVKIFNYALTESQVKSAYNGGAVLRFE